MEEEEEEEGSFGQQLTGNPSVWSLCDTMQVGCQARLITVIAAAANEALRLIKKTSRTQAHNEEPVYQSIRGHEYANKSWNHLLAASPGLEGDQALTTMAFGASQDKRQGSEAGKRHAASPLPTWHRAPCAD